MIAIRGKAFWLWVILITAMVPFAAAKQKEIDAKKAKASHTVSNDKAAKPSQSNDGHDPD